MAGEASQCRSAFRIWRVCSVVSPVVLRGVLPIVSHLPGMGHRARFVYRMLGSLKARAPPMHEQYARASGGRGHYRLLRTQLGRCQRTHYRALRAGCARPPHDRLPRPAPRTGDGVGSSTDHADFCSRAPGPALYPLRGQRRSCRRSIARVSGVTPAEDERAPCVYDLASRAIGVPAPHHTGMVDL